MLFNDERVEPLSDDLDEWRPSTPASLSCISAAIKTKAAQLVATSVGVAVGAIIAAGRAVG